MGIWSRIFGPPHTRARQKARRGLVDDGVVLTVLGAMRAERLAVAATPEGELVLEALRRSTTSLASNATPAEISAYLQRYDAEQLTGVASNIKGIAHELAYVQAENIDGDPLTAELFENTNHPGADVRLTNEVTGEHIDIQLKATSSSAYAEAALERYPDIPVLATTEAAAGSTHPMVADSGISNAELTADVASVLDGMTLSADELAGAVGVAVAASTGLRLLLGARGHSQLPVALRQELLREAGTAALRAAVFVLLGSTPLAPAVAAYTAARLGLGAVRMVVEAPSTEREDCHGPLVPRLCGKGET